MKFIDTLELEIEAGSGGRGCMSFRREKFVPRGGPDGGNGGKGGDVIFVGDGSRHTLLDLSYRKHYKAERGEHGKGKDMHGRTGKDAVIQVPVGTIVKNAVTGEIITDITREGQEVHIARGGRGGRGNASFVSPTHRAPREFEEGTKGEKLKVILELKLLADVGIIGMPNAGKSTFISTVSAARPKVADYPFTTLTPKLGVVKGQYGQSYVLADMPGLIEGASEGVGLGIRFLKHIERTKVLVHFVDSSQEEPMTERYETIRSELDKYGEHVGKKYEIIVATKTDSAVEENLSEFEKKYNTKDTDFFRISSITKEGLKELLGRIEEVIDGMQDDEESL